MLHNNIIGPDRTGLIVGLTIVGVIILVILILVIIWCLWLIKRCKSSKFFLFYSASTDYAMTSVIYNIGKKQSKEKSEEDGGK